MMNWKGLIFSLLVLSLGQIAYQPLSFSDEVKIEQPASILEKPASIKISLLSEEKTIQPGHPFWVAIRIQFDKNWHAYWKNPGNSGMATKVEWKLPEGFTASPLVWPTPERLDIDGINVYGYKGEFILLSQITPPSSYTSSKPPSIGAQVTWLICSDSQCVPGKSDTNTITLSVTEMTPKINKKWEGLFAKARASAVQMPETDSTLEKSTHQTESAVSIQTFQAPSENLDGGLAMALLLAFSGGMILNLMPCVLPIVSFKILSFVNMANKCRILTLKHGLAFFFGVLISFWSLAGTLLILQMFGQSVGWGFQLQDPLFVAILAAILLVFGLSMFGLFELGSFATNLAGQVVPKEELSGSFMSGILATIVATPCTGPFLGTAVGFAFTASAPAAMLIFTFLGLGMALPYLILAAFPQLLRFLPKPGVWMETFKQVVGFIIVATILWLIWVFSAQTSSLSVVLLLFSFFWISLACWIYGKWGSPVNTRFSRLISSVLIIASLGTGIYIITTATSSAVTEVANADHVAGTTVKLDAPRTNEWETFSPERVAYLQSQGIPVLIDFTAKWCLVCQVNHAVLASDVVDKKLADLGVVKMKADWTKNDLVITNELRKFGRNSVPLYVLYTKDPQEQPHILPQVLTAETVIQHLEQISK